jgi:hypothetical protein
MAKKESLNSIPPPPDNSGIKPTTKTSIPAPPDGSGIVSSQSGVNPFQVDEEIRGTKQPVVKPVVEEPTMLGSFMSNVKSIWGDSSTETKPAGEIKKADKKIDENQKVYNEALNELKLYPGVNNLKEVAEFSKTLDPNNIGDQVLASRVKFGKPPVDATYKMGIAALNLGKTDEAISMFSATLGNLTPETEDTGKRAMVQNQMAKDIETKKSAATNPANSLYGIGNALALNGSYKEAIGYYEDALKVDPSNANVQKGLAFSKGKLGLKDEAQEHLKSAIKLSKPDALVQQIEESATDERNKDQRSKEVSGIADMLEAFIGGNDPQNKLGSIGFLNPIGKYVSGIQQGAITIGQGIKDGSVLGSTLGLGETAFATIPAVTAFNAGMSATRDAAKLLPEKGEQAVNELMDIPFQSVTLFANSLGYHPEDSSDAKKMLELADIIASFGTMAAAHKGVVKAGEGLKSIQETAKKIVADKATGPELNEVEDYLSNVKNLNINDIKEAAIKKGTPEAMEVALDIDNVQPKALTREDVNNKYREQSDLQSKQAYDAIQNGPEAVDALKNNIDMLSANGELSPEQQERAIAKIDSYQKYRDQTKDLGLDTDNERRVHDLSWSNENLKVQSEALKQNPDAAIPGSITHIRLNETENMLRDNSREMEELISPNIMDQQSAVSEKATLKAQERFKKVKEQPKPTAADTKNPVMPQESLWLVENLRRIKNELDPDLNDLDVFNEARKQYKEIQAGKRPIEDSVNTKSVETPLLDNKEPIKSDAKEPMSDIVEQPKIEPVEEIKLPKEKEKFIEDSINELKEEGEYTPSFHKTYVDILSRKFDLKERLKTDKDVAKVTEEIKVVDKDLREEVKKQREKNVSDYLTEKGYSEEKITEARNKTNEILDKPDIEFIKELDDRGFFNPVGDVNAVRLDLQMNTADIKKALSDIDKGKLNTAPVKALIERLGKAKETGDFDFIEGTGGKRIKKGFSLEEMLIDEEPVDLTEQEVEFEKNITPTVKAALEQGVTLDNLDTLKDELFSGFPFDGSDYKELKQYFENEKKSIIESEETDKKSEEFKQATEAVKGEESVSKEKGSEVKEPSKDSKSESKDLASRIRKNKISGLTSSIDFGVTRLVVNTALELAAKEVEKGSKIGVAIEKAVKWVDSQMAGKKWNKKDFIEYATNLEESKQIIPGSPEDIQRAVKLTKEQPAEIKTELQEAKRSVSDIISDSFAPVSTVLGDINPVFKRALRDYQLDFETAIKSDVKEVTTYLELKKKLLKKDKDKWSSYNYALINYGEAWARDLVKEYNKDAGISEAEVSKIDNLYEQIYNDSKAVGIDLGHKEHYRARVVKDVDGLMQYLDTEHPDDSRLLREMIQYKEALLGRPMSLEEKGTFISSMLLQENKATSLAGIGNFKLRSINHVSPDMLKYYYDADTAMLHYITGAREAISRRKLFGKTDATTGTLTFGESLGLEAWKLIEKGELTAAQFKKVQDIIAAYFNKDKASKAVTVLKNLAYIDLLGNIKSAVSNLSDIGMAMNESGVMSGLKNAAKSLVGKSDIKMNEILADDVVHDFENNVKVHGVADTIYKWSGFRHFDKMGKEAQINSIMDRLSADASKYDKMKPSEKVKFKKSITDWVDDQNFEDVVKDLKNKKLTEQTLKLVYNRMLDLNPIGKSEMSEFYLKNVKSRWRYAFHSYTLKRWDVYRREVIRKCKSSEPEERLDGYKRLVKMAAALSFAQIGTSAIQDLISGKKVDLGEGVLYSFEQILGLSPYLVSKLKREGSAGATAALLSTPVVGAPLTMLDDIYNDVFGKGGGKSLKHLPLFGMPLYGLTHPSKKSGN